MLNAVLAVGLVCVLVRFSGALAGAAPPRTARRWRRAILPCGVALVAALLLWRPALRGCGAALIAEDDLAAVDYIIVSSSTAVSDAFEAAALYRDGYAPRVLVPGSALEPNLDRLHSLGIPQLSSAELVRAVLERSGVPAAAIEVVPDTVDGTATEAAVIAAFVARRQPRRILVVTARSHSARTRWLLRRLLPAETILFVRSPTDDPFQPDRWWRSRDSAREAITEYMRWANTLLGDLWG
jgi:uncharacterized SAM-binding protein YcdF (DUF218 family)